MLSDPRTSRRQEMQLGPGPLAIIGHCELAKSVLLLQVRGHPDARSPSVLANAAPFDQRLVTLLSYQLFKQSVLKHHTMRRKTAPPTMSSSVSGPSDVRPGPADLEPPSDARKAFVSHSLAMQVWKRLTPFNPSSATFWAQKKIQCTRSADCSASCEALTSTCSGSLLVSPGSVKSDLKSPITNFVYLHPFSLRSRRGMQQVQPAFGLLLGLATNEGLLT
jgi:hypothetical protein